MESRKALNTFMASLHLCEKHESWKKICCSARRWHKKIMGHLFGHNSLRKNVIFCNNYCGYAMIRKCKKEIYCKKNHWSSVNSTKLNEVAIDVIDIQKPNTPSQRF